MNQIQKALEELIAEVETCEEYKRYLAAKKEIEKYPLLKKKADEFRKLKFNLQSSETDIFEKTDQLRFEHAEVNSGMGISDSRKYFLPDFTADQLAVVRTPGF